MMLEPLGRVDSALFVDRFDVVNSLERVAYLFESYGETQSVGVCDDEYFTRV